MNIFLLTIFAFGALVEGQVIPLYFTLPLDHFGISDPGTFQVRYYVNENLYRETGPVFIYLQLGDASTKYITEGNMYEIAEKEGGVLISLETRYYVDSRPTSDTSVENLQWFTVYQMVADVGRFATFIKEKYSNAPVILWASDLGSALATWTRQTYPSVINGAWGSSAYINIDVEDSNYFPNMRKIITQFGGDDCMRIIDDALSQIENFLRNGDASWIEEMFNPCSSFDAMNDLDILGFMYTIELDLGTSLSSGNIGSMCQIVKEYEDNGYTQVDSFTKWYNDYFPFYETTKCRSSADTKYTKTLQEEGWESETSNMRLLMWLKCTQIGMFKTSENRYTFQFYQQICAIVFGRDSYLSETIENVKSEFGRFDRTTHLLLTQGELDAHRSLGPAFDLNSQSPVFVIPGEGDSSDLDAPDISKDSGELYDIKIKIQETIREWIRLARTGENQPQPQPQLQIQNCSAVEDINSYPVVIEHQIQSCSPLESITLYPLIFASIVIALFLIWCAAKFFIRCRRGGKHLQSNICMESEKSYKEFGQIGFVDSILH